MNSIPADDHVYGLKRDWNSSNRLNLQHYLWRASAGYNLHPDILAQTGPQLRIADIGAGTAIWMLDVHEELPEAQLDGFDISLDQCPVNESLPFGLSIQQLDVTQPIPEHLRGIYDVVHIRLFLVAIKNNDPGPILRNCLDLLKPGGHIQWEEQNVATMVVDSPRESVKRSALDTMADTMKAVETIKWPSWLGTVLVEHGMQDVKKHLHPTIPAHRLFWTQMQFNSTEEFTQVAMDNSTPESSGPKFREIIYAAVRESLDGVVLNFTLECHVARKPLELVASSVVPQETQDAQPLLQELKAIKAKLETLSSSGDKLDYATRQSLLHEAKQLVYALEEPVEKLGCIAKGPVDNAILKVGIDSGLYAKFNGSGQKTTEQISELTGIHKTLLLRILWASAALGIYNEVEAGVWTPTRLSEALVDANARDFLRGFAETANLMQHLPDYLSSESYRDHETFSKSLFHYANNSQETFYQWLQRNPKQLNIFAAFQRGLNQMSKKDLPVLLRDLLIQANASTTSEVLAVDLGSGNDTTWQSVCATLPEIMATRKVIMQDLPSVMARATPGNGVEMMAHDFFNPQPVKGAAIYYFRSILHNWSNNDCLRILSNTVVAFSDRQPTASSTASRTPSKIVIVDAVLPSKDVSHFMSVVDISMLAFGGYERSLTQWTALLDQAGLEIERTLNFDSETPWIGFKAIVAVLKGSSASVSG